MASKLMDEVRRILHLHHYSFETEKVYCHWIRKFILYHDKQHPKGLGATEIEAFLSYLATDRRVSASTQNQALSGILFLYQKVLGTDLPQLDGIVRAKRPVRVPVVLTRAEVKKVLDVMSGQAWLAANLMYGSGLRLVECLRLRIQDIDCDYLQVTVRDGKGAKDRRTMLAERLVPHIKRQFEHVKAVHERDVELNLSGVSIPYALDRKYQGAPKQWQWQYVFPSVHCAFI